MTRVHLIEGPVGAGKSTFAQALTTRERAVHIALDEWFARLFSADRPTSDFITWYIQRKDRLLDLIWSHSRLLLAANCNVALELGLVQRQERMDFCRKIQDEGFDLSIYVLDAPLEVRRERVRRRNSDRGSTFSMVVPDHIFEIAGKAWEPPDEVECSGFQIEFIDSH